MGEWNGFDGFAYGGICMKLGRYRLIGQRGAGADGLAFQAVDEQTGLPCEVRELADARANPARWQELQRRLRLAGLLSHGSQWQLRSLELENDPPFLVLEGLTAPPLAEVHQDEL